MKKAIVSAFFLLTVLGPKAFCAIGGAAVDLEGKALNTIAVEHYHIHQGDSYYIVGSTSLASGQICEFLVQTSSGVEPHMVFSFGSTAAFTFIGYEASTWSSTGATAVVPLNNDRNSANSSSLTVYRSTGTGVTTGTIIDGPMTYGTTGSPLQRSGASSSRVDELVLKKSTKYLFRFTNGSDANIINFRSSWYEIEE